MTRIRAGFEPPVERPTVEDYAVSKASCFDERFKFRTLRVPTMFGPKPIARRGSNPAPCSDIRWHISDAPRFSPYLFVRFLRLFAAIPSSSLRLFHFRESPQVLYGRFEGAFENLGCMQRPVRIPQHLSS